MCDVLIVVDVQKDFCAGGALEVPDADSLIESLNQVVAWAYDVNMLVVFTRDWHPEEHSSFAEFGGQWPTHCVQNTPGAEFHDDLLIPENVHIVNAGIESDKLGYSAYEDTKMAQLITQPDISTVFVTGIALEYCVRAACLDTIKLGKQVVAIELLIRSISNDKSILERRWNELMAAGVVRAQDMSES